jgi:hypothetical protein
MSVNAEFLIADALQKLGVYAPGEALNAADYATGLSVMNQMLDGWSNQSLTCYAIKEQTLTYVPGQFQYSIGPGGFVNDTRPLRIIAVSGSCYTLDSNGNQYGIDVITQDQWNMRGSRNTNSNFPDVLFYDPQEPLGFLNFDPIPNIGYQVFFDSYLQLSELASLTSTITLPPGYQLAIASNLAVKLKPYYIAAGVQIDPLVMKEAMDSLADVKRTNIRLRTAKFDPEILSRAPGIYNIYTDGYRR